jgi:hypothetical protein
MSASLGYRAVSALCLVLSAAAFGCSGDSKTTTAPNAGITPEEDAGPQGEGEPVALCPEENPYCDDAPADPGTDCGSQAIDLTPVGVNVMVAVDGAASMATHWPRIQSAVKALRDAQPDIAVGLQVFWGELVENLESGLAKSNWCGNTQNNVLDVGENTAQALVDFLGATPPGPSFVGGVWETAPVIEPLNYYLTHASKLADPARTNYLVFITNGNDNCFGNVFAKKDDKLQAYEKLAIELSKLNIRLIPVGFDASAKPDSSGNFGMVEGNTDLDVLSTLLKFGGSGLAEVPKVDDPAKLGEVLAQVGQTVRNCRFEIPAVLDPTKSVNPFQLDFAVNGVVVPRDRLHKEGWNFVDGNTSQVELFGQACEAVRADAKLEAKKTCAEDVCGTSAIKVETKERAVLYLMDSSGSRMECIDGSLGCLAPPDLPPELWVRTSVTYWEQVLHAVNGSLVAPINDDIDFGVQFFPGKNASALTCDLEATPEIPPAQGTEISMMSAMMEKIPLGFSPVVQVLENVAANPGRLAAPDVEAAIVMLTDGGDNCSGANQEEIVTRLGDATASLFDKGIETYLVRFGSDAGKTPEQDAQLRAIVANGGTASSDPNDATKIPYVDAKNDAELNRALATISDTLATCAFALGGLEQDADTANANLYLNGENIPFDATKAGQEGWGWQDEAQTSVQLFGEACEAFKTNRRTSVVMEFGCAPVTVF